MSNESEAMAHDPLLQRVIQHERLRQTIACIRMVRYQRRQAVRAGYREAYVQALVEAEIHLRAGARRLKNGELFDHSTSTVDHSRSVR